MVKPVPLPRLIRPIVARARACASLGSLLLFAACQGERPTPDSGALEAPPPRDAPSDRPGPWADDARPSDSAEAAASAAPQPSADEPGREIAGAAHILVAYKGALQAPKEVTRSKEAAKKRAEEALARLKSKKATFEELVKAYSDDAASAPMQGALGNFERYAMPPAFADATFKLTVGEISEVIETPRGFHIIRRTR